MTGKFDWDKWNKISQVGLPVFTILGFLLTSIKMPQYGLISNLVAQLFWLPSSYRAWKHAGQIGIFITTLVITAVVVTGVINYWIL